MIWRYTGNLHQITSWGIDYYTGCLTGDPVCTCGHRIPWALLGELDNNLYWLIRRQCPLEVIQLTRKLFLEYNISETIRLSDIAKMRLENRLAEMRTPIEKRHRL